MTAKEQDHKTKRSSHRAHLAELYELGASSPQRAQKLVQRESTAAWQARDDAYETELARTYCEPPEPLYRIVYIDRDDGKQAGGVAMSWTHTQGILRGMRRRLRTGESSLVPIRVERVPTSSRR